MIPCTCSYIYNYTSFPNFTFINAQVTSQLCIVVSPKFYEVPGNAFVSLARVQCMNAERTGNWIRTLADSRGWKNGDNYAKSFKEENISGLGLQHLTHHMLVERFGIENLKHRREILSAIRYLYCGFPIVCDYLSSGAQSSASELESKISASKSDGSDNDRTSKRPSLNCGREHEMNGLRISAMTGARKSYPAVEIRKSRMYPMDNHRTSNESNVGFVFTTPVKSRKLRVIINPEQANCPETSKMLIRNRFQELNIQVEDVKDLESKPNEYVVVFSDCKRAVDAHSRSEEIGLRL